jgi:rubredoxin
MLELCDILGIGVNELLRGEKINLEEQSRKTEELLLEFTKRDETRRKRLLIRAWLLTIVMVFFFIGSAFLASLAFQDNRLVEGIAIYTAFALYSVGLFFAATMEIDAGHYVCQTCQHEFEPTYTAALFSLQFGTTKNLKIRLRCPKCGKKTWAKRVLPK